MSHQNFWRPESGMSSTDATIEYARKMIQAEARGPGDLEPAMTRLEARTGIGFWTLRGLWYRRRKLVDNDLFLAVRGAYLSLCERQVAIHQHNLAVEAKKGGEDVVSDLVAEAEILVARLKAARARMSGEGDR